MKVFLFLDCSCFGCNEWKLAYFLLLIDENLMKEKYTETFFHAWEQYHFTAGEAWVISYQKQFIGEMKISSNVHFLEVWIILSLIVFQFKIYI